MSVRNFFISLTIVVLHMGVVAGLVFKKSQTTAPQVITVSLFGSLIKPSASSQENALTNLATTKPAIIERLPAPLEKPVVQEARSQNSPKPLPVTNSPTQSPTRVPPKPVIQPPAKPLPVAPLAPSTPPITPAETQASPSTTQAPAADAAGGGARNESREQGEQESSGEAVTAPSSNASYLNNAKPVYPPLSRRLKEEGLVILRVLVNAQGRAQSVEIKQSSSFARLDQAALDAVRRWRFVPAKRGITPIDMWYEVPVKFSLNS